MKLAVTGANGTLGRALVASAIGRGHDVIAIVRKATPSAVPGAVLRVADVATGDGLDAALAGADAVVNAVNARQAARSLLVEGTRRILASVRQARVGHYVAVSIVGIDRVPLAYYGIKLEEERVVESDGAVGWSLLRATQFHDLVDAMFRQTARFGALLAPWGARLQPIDVGEVADALVAAAEAGPKGRLPDIGGPEILTLHQLARQWIFAKRKLRLILPPPVPGKLGASLREGALCTPGGAVGKKTFRTWLEEHRS